MALKSRLGCAQWVWVGANHTGSSHRNVLTQEVCRQTDKDGLGGALSCQKGVYEMQGTWFPWLSLGESASGDWHEEWSLLELGPACPRHELTQAWGLSLLRASPRTVPGVDDCFSAAWQLWLLCWGVLTLNL